MKKPPPILLFVLLMPLFATSCHRTETNPIREAELTKDDIIYLYKVPVKDQPYTKIEWSLPKPAYVRMVIEKKLPTQTTWTIYRTLAERFPAKTYTLYYHLKCESSPVTGVESASWIMQGHRKLGGPIKGPSANFDGFKMSSVMNSAIESFAFNFPLPAPYNRSESQVPPVLRPDWIVTFGNSNLQYRLRLEQSETPFPGIQY